MNIVSRIILAGLAAAFMSNPAQAEVSRRAIAQACFNAMLAGKTAEVDAAVEQILSWTELEDAQTINVATMCLKQVRKGQFAYSTTKGRFLHPDETARESPTVRSGELCAEAVKAKDAADIAEWRALILEWRNVFDTSAIRSAKVCLDAMGDGPWTWHGPSGRFRIKAEADEQDRAAMEAKAVAAAAERKAEDDRQARKQAAREAAAARRDEAARRTVEACYTLFASDEVAALTNPVCSPIFLANGLPE